MATEASRSTTNAGGGSAADSYLGSLISLTSKSDIRYEGVLFSIDTDEASIGLRNVRSFGTEGRRKDGPQVPAIDKVYEYIVFRGSDIKDLQVKSAPPVQKAPSVQNDPAIIQSHYTPPAAPSSFPTAPSTATPIGGSVPDSGTQIPQAGIPQTTHQNNNPMYPPGGNLPPWNPSPSPATNSSGLPPPMYWPGYYGASAYNQPQQQPLTGPAQGLPMQPSFQSPLAQQPILYPNMNSSFQTGASNISAPQSMGFPPPPVQPINNTTVGPSSSLDSSNMMPFKAPPQELPVLSQSANPSSVSSTSSNILDRSSIPTLIPNQAKPVFSSPMPFNSMPEPLSSVGGTSSAPALVTPGQFLQPEPPVSHTSQIAQKDVEVVHVPPFGSRPQPPVRAPVTAAPVQVSAETQAPLLPLPSPIIPKMNAVSSHTQYVNHGGRGRGRGNEFSRSVPNYNEEFDFEAMNERFKKDEVWGHLGKSISKTDDGPDLQDEDDVDVPAADKKPIYKKDDFFDTLSCNALDRESRGGRTRFSERMRVDTETFGEFSRNQGFRGGRGGGRPRGGYHGRDNGYGYGGYGGRGRGQNVYRPF
ncbi:protein decapping 5-like [Silene latifolia]|uniref:protein decapping 5-like n=1 Tax=Silene latifolia TaxID=37657 RepID=UPI003D778F9E